MKHVSLDEETQPIRDFVSALTLDPEGSILEIRGEPVARIVPVRADQVDVKKLKAAILNWRGQSRTLNEDWQAVDAEAWDHGE